MWETFAAQFAAGAGKGLGGAIGGSAPVSSGLNLQGAAWQVGAGDWSAPITVTAASPGAAVTADAGGSKLPAWVWIAAGLGALWIIGKR